MTLLQIEILRGVTFEISKLASHIGDYVLEGLEIETYENTLYIILKEAHKTEIATLLEREGLEFIVAKDHNGLVKFMIEMGA